MSLRRSSRSHKPSRQLIEAIEHGLDEYFLAAQTDAAATPKKKRSKAVNQTPQKPKPIPCVKHLERLRTEDADETDACVACNMPALNRDLLMCPCCRRLLHLHCGFERKFKSKAHMASSVTQDDSDQLTPFCRQCEQVDLRPKLTALRLGETSVLTKGGKLLLSCIRKGYTPRAIDGDASLKHTFGCHGFELRRGLISPAVCQQLLKTIHTDLEVKDGIKQSMLTPSITDLSRKVYCCTEEQRQMRGGRYSTCPLKPSNTLDLIQQPLESGQDINQFIEQTFPSNDPFIVRTKLLCQQVAWHYEDLELHCDRERPDKLSTKQEAGFDGIGDRITSLTLRSPCWLLLRERAYPKNHFAVWLQPGDVYTMAGDSRWKWQHGIFLPSKPSKTDNNCRISIVFRLLEEHPE
eukprot:TRINITY_DN9200_c0_g1_i1.p1 TRINITY_DN9200_c0_g1~~TRINITY_DN9200_c0_g1_i1.p1  ORF type:complete len:407 (+),score=63.07 TRINITY_DN9200_c0_g1_i1:188-1408(+)